MWTNSDSLSVEPVFWSVYEVRADRAPVISCQAAITRIGERPVTTIPAVDQTGSGQLCSDQLAELMDGDAAAPAVGESVKPA